MYQSRPSAATVLATVLATFIAAASFSVPAPVNAALTAHYSLDDLNGGLINLGTDGSTSDLSAPDALTTPTVVQGIIGSGALRFDGNDVLRALSPGNAGDDIGSYPFTMSLWVNNVANVGSRSTMFTISNRAVSGTYYGTGVQLANGILEPELIRRNPNFTEVNATGVNVQGSNWTNIFSVFGSAGAQIYVGGKLINSAGPGGETYSSTVDTMALGGFLRNGSTTAPTDPYSGDLDDVGLFDTALAASDAALVNGLGHVGGIGLEWLDEAQSLNAMALGTTALIDGLPWEKVTGLAGTTGDFGGTVGGADAYIVTAPDGSGLRLVPEPGTASLAALGALAATMRRRRGSSQS